MWLATKFGFFSVVRNTNPHDLGRNSDREFILRTRRADDIRGLLAAFNVAEEHRYTNERVELTPKADYPARVFISRDEWLDLMLFAANAIDYGNFKAKIGTIPQQDADKHSAYASIWGIMNRTGDRSGQKRLAGDTPHDEYLTLGMTEFNGSEEGAPN